MRISQKVSNISTIHETIEQLLPEFLKHPECVSAQKDGESPVASSGPVVYAGSVENLATPETVDNMGAKGAQTSAIPSNSEPAPLERKKSKRLGMKPQKGHLGANNPNAFRLWKSDPTSPETRSWLLADQRILHYSIHNNDELKLVNIHDAEYVNVSLPPSSIVHQIKCGYETRVSDMKGFLIASGSLLNRQVDYNKTKHAIYHPRFGTLLDLKKRIWDYDSHADDVLVLKELSLERDIRIRLVDFDTIFALPVLLSMTGKDLESIIEAQICERNLVLNPKGTFELFEPKNEKWIEKDKPISYYEDETIIITNLVFKMRYLDVTVKIQKQKSVFKLDKDSTAASLNQAASLKAVTIGGHEYGLYTLAGELLKPEELIWAAAKDNMDDDYFTRRQISQKIILKSICCGDASASIDVCFDYSMNRIIPIVARRLGVRDTDISSVSIDGQKKGTG